MERRLENLIGERDEHDFKVSHRRPRNVNNNRRIEEQEKLDNKVMLNMKTNAPTFDGDLDPTVYMDELREWMATSSGSVSLEKRVHFCKNGIELTGRAKLHWQTVEQLLKRMHQPPITD